MSLILFSEDIFFSGSIYMSEYQVSTHTWSIHENNGHYVYSYNDHVNICKESLNNTNEFCYNFLKFMNICTWNIRFLAARLRTLCHESIDLLNMLCLDNLRWNMIVP